MQAGLSIFKTCLDRKRPPNWTSAEADCNDIARNELANDNGD